MAKFRKFFSSISPTIIKYSFTAILIFVGCWRVSSPTNLFFALMEWAICFFACNAVAQKSRIAGSVLSSIVLLLIDVQMLLLIFGNSYLSLVMLTNLDSLEDLSGKMAVYIAAIIGMAAFICLPIRHVNLRLPRLSGKMASILPLALLACTEVVGLVVLGYQNSPLGAYVSLAFEHSESVQMEEELKKKPNMTLQFYREGVNSYITKPSEIVEQPNIVLIFTEGLSQNVIDDERDIMTNVREYQQKSISFTSYYNHGFATYRGLAGQLFSGYQNNNFDTSTLVSLPQIFEDQGYSTGFINVEPSNREFYEYLTHLGFQQVMDYPREEAHGAVRGHFSDKEAYERLFNEMESASSKDKPFLISMYTVGTHASFDSVNERFGDGLDSEINKFYDADVQFGAFMKRFVKSPFHDNTIVVYTADHCSYADMYYKDSFYNYERKYTEVDTMPLFIYYKGVEPQEIDVQGRNTLGMAPTVLDFLDVSAPNYFLGTSLFSPLEEASSMETFFTDGGATRLSTAGGTIHKLEGSAYSEATVTLQNYYAAKKQEPLTPDDVDSKQTTGEQGPTFETALPPVVSPSQDGATFMDKESDNSLVGPPAPETT